MCQALLFLRKKIQSLHSKLVEVRDKIIQDENIQTDAFLLKENHKADLSGTTQKDCCVGLNMLGLGTGTTGTVAFLKQAWPCWSRSDLRSVSL